jgi:hypothetical protein
VPVVATAKQNTISQNAIAGLRKRSARAIVETVQNTEMRPPEAMLDYSNNNRIIKLIYSIANAIRAWVIKEQHAEHVGINTLQGSLALLPAIAYGTTSWLMFKQTYDLAPHLVEQGQWRHENATGGVYSRFYAPDTAVYEIGAFFKCINLKQSVSENMYLELRVQVSTDNEQTWGNEIVIAGNSGNLYGQSLENGYEICTLNGTTLLQLHAGNCLRIGIYNYSYMANAIQDMTQLEYRATINKVRIL